MNKNKNSSSSEQAAPSQRMRGAVSAYNIMASSLQLPVSRQVRGQQVAQAVVAQAAAVVQAARRRTRRWRSQRWRNGRGKARASINHYAPTNVQWVPLITGTGSDARLDEALPGVYVA
eukprot:5678779-Prymnesium_polylepis.1